MEKTHNPFVSVIIPVYNEEKSIAKVISDIPKELISEIIVVDNGSTDQTVNILQKFDVRLIKEPKRGYGQACLSGMDALNNQTDIVVFLDGDYSDYPQEMAQLIAPIRNYNADFVIGSRVLGQRESGALMPQALFGNQLACFLMKLFWSVEYTDLGPFRAIRYESLKLLTMVDRNFGWTIEMQIKAACHALRIKEVPVSYRRRLGQSKISGTFRGTMQAGEKILRTIFKYKFINPQCRNGSA